MASSTVAPASTDARTERYRHAERALWGHYGLEPRERFVELDSPPTRLRLLEVGSGEPILFVHGTVGPGSWAPLVRELGDFRCLVLERPGWGLSSPVDFSERDYGVLVADVLGGALTALGIERTSVVGGSIGNVWALRLAGRNPARVRRVVLMGGSPLVAEAGVPGIIRLLASPLGSVLVRLPDKAERIRAILRQSGHGASLDAGRIPDAFVDWRVALGRETDSMRNEREMVRTAVVRGRAYRPGVSFDEGELAAVAAATLLVYGTADPVGTVDVWRRTTSLLPRGELRLFEGFGHQPWLDDPARVAAEVGRFLAA